MSGSIHDDNSEVQEKNDWYSLVDSDDFKHNGAMVDDGSLEKSHRKSDRESEVEIASQDDMIELTRRSVSSDLKSFGPQESVSDDSNLITNKKSTEISGGEKLELSEKAAEQWFKLEMSIPSEENDAKEARSSDQQQMVSPDNRKLSTVSEEGLDDVLPLVIPHKQAISPSYNQKIKHIASDTIVHDAVEPETASLEEDAIRSVLSDVTDKSISSSHSSIYARPTNEKTVQEKTNIAAMQRPEPLGKARVENEIKQMTGMSGSTLPSGKKVDENIVVEQVVADNSSVLKISRKFDESCENRASEKSKVSHSGDVDSNSGLEEQAYPVRVPLSLSEGYNRLSYEAQYTQVDRKSKDLDNSSEQILHNADKILDELSKRESPEKESGVRKKTSEDVTTLFKSKSSDKVALKSNVYEINRKSASHATTGRHPETAVVDSDTATPISKLLGPSYKSSVALLEDLRKRRFRNSNSREVKTRESDPKSVDNADPMKLAENAMKASNILSNRTEKSLKRATEVLEAVKEHRTPPGNSSESFLVGSMEDSLAVKLREFSLSSLSVGSGNTSEDKNDEKDSIDRIIEERLRKQENSSTSNSLSSVWSDAQGKSKTADENSYNNASKKLLQSDSDSSRFLSIKSKHDVDDPVRSGSQAIMNTRVSPQQIESSLDDVTSSELLKLKSFGNETDSPYYDSHVSKIKAANLLKDISPIEQQSTRPTAREIGFRSSSRIHNEKHIPGKQINFSDSEIVRLHRSLGAGTVTPLPEMSFDRSGEKERGKAKDTSAPISMSSGFSSIVSSGVEEHKDSTTEDPTKGIEYKHPTRSDSPAERSTREKLVTIQSKPRTKETTQSYSVQSDILTLTPSTESSQAGQSSILQENREKDPSIRRPVQNQSGSLQNDDQNKPYGTVRGIYDIRDSSGPGSTNRKRRNIGKQPLQRKEKSRDPFTVYVSEQSKSSVASSKYLENAQPNSALGFEDQQEAQGNEESFRTRHPDAKGTTESTFSSMSSQSPFLSYSGEDGSMVAGSNFDTGYRDRSYPRNPKNALVDVKTQKETSHLGVKDYKRSIVSAANHRTMSSGKDSTLEDSKKARDFLTPQQHDNGKDRKDSPFTFKPPPFRSAWTDEKSNPNVPRRPSDFNSLWQKFQERFEPSTTSGRGDVFEKIGILSEIINEQGTKTPRPVSGNEIKLRKEPKFTEQKAVNRELREIKMKEKYSERTTEPCCNCKKRDVGTNCPTPVSFESELDGAEIPQPLLLHTWTQTTPMNTGRHIEEGFNKRMPATKIVSPVPAKHVKSSNKENTQNTANTQHTAKGVQSKVIESEGKSAPSWSVTFEEKHRKEALKKHSLKPPIPPISKADLQADRDNKKKRREPIFTAWFQSTRSDTSSGTVIPLSEVPKLASSFKDNRNAPKMYIEETRPKETESVVRVGLQEAFRFAKEDFIQRSKERVEHVKNARLNANHKKNIRNLKERQLTEAVVINQPIASHPSKIEHLFKLKKRQIDKKEMREQNRKMYEKLPEVVKKREEDLRKAQYASNRIRLKQFDKKLRTRLLKSKRM